MILKPTAGGTLPVNDPNYIDREADQTLLAELTEGHFCYVLTTRQMGKSSLMARTAVRLRETGKTAVTVDLTEIGAADSVTEERWYYGVLRQIAKDTDRLEGFKEWWLANDDLTHTTRMMEFFKEWITLSPDSQLVVFIDEIDSTIPLDFTDDFFAAIRALYNGRSTTPVFQWVCFCLLGVATPVSYTHLTLPTICSV